jgi:hypothetical protein
MPKSRCPFPWFARVGAAAFCFFLLKGLVWLSLPAVLAYCAAR